MRMSRRPAGTTLAAALLIAGLTAAFLTFVVRTTAPTAARRDGLELDASLFGLNPEQAQGATTLTNGLIIAISVLSVLFLVGILRRRQGARLAAIVFYGVLAVVVSLVSWSGLTSEPPSRNAAWGLACGVIDAIIAGLLLAPATADDFGRAEHERTWQQVRGEPLTPQRR